VKALVVPERGRIEFTDIPEPQTGPYEARVRIVCCGICNSTDWKVINGQMSWAGDCPLVLGHESVGVVESIGEKVRKFALGDLVTRPIYPRGSELGSAWGGFSEVGIVVDAQAMADDGGPSMLDDYNAQRQNVVPDGVDPVAAALAISLAETASVLDDAPSLAGKRVVVAGTGIAGLALTMWSKLAGARAVVTLGRRAERMVKARQLGADATVDTTETDWQDRVRATLGGAADLAFEAIGDASFASEVLGLLHADGDAIAYGVPPNGRAFDPRWRSADVREQDRYAWVADLIRRGWVNPNWFVSHRWSPDEITGAFDQVRRGEVLKGFIVFDSSR